MNKANFDSYSDGLKSLIIALQHGQLYQGRETL
jgi:hypothetical protein